MLNLLPLINNKYLICQYALTNNLTKIDLKNMLSCSRDYTIQQFIELGLFTNDDITSLFSSIEDIRLLTRKAYGSQSITQLIELGYSRNQLYNSGFSIWNPEETPIASNNKSEHVIIKTNKNGNIIAIGNPLYKDEHQGTVGQVVIYSRLNDSWSIMNNFIGTSESPIGYSISLSFDGMVFAFSAHCYNGKDGNNIGRVYIYEYGLYKGSFSSFPRGLPIDGDKTNDKSGLSISLNSFGNIIAIGSPFNNTNGDKTGHTRVYEYINSTWILKGNIIYGINTGDFSGGSVSLNGSGTTIAIGPYNSIMNNGNVYVYEYNSNIKCWFQKGKTIQGKHGEVFSGNSISLNSIGNILAIGRIHNINSNKKIGQVCIYEYYDSPSYISTISNRGNKYDNDWEIIGNDIHSDNNYNCTSYSISLCTTDNPKNIFIAIETFGTNCVSQLDIGYVRTYKLKINTTHKNEWEQFGGDIHGIIRNNSESSVSLICDGSILIISSFSSSLNTRNATGETTFFNYHSIDYETPLIESGSGSESESESKSESESESETETETKMKQCKNIVGNQKLPTRIRSLGLSFT